MALTRRTVRSPIFHLAIALIFAPVLAIAGEAFGGVTWLIAGGAASCFLIAVAGLRCCRYAVAESFNDLTVMKVKVVTTAAALVSAFLTGLFLVRIFSQ